MRSTGGTPSRFASFFASAVNVPVVMRKSFVTTARQSAAEVANDAGADAPLVALALEEHGETDQAHMEDATSVDSAVIALAKHRDVIDASLAQETAREPLESIGLHRH